MHPLFNRIEDFLRGFMGKEKTTDGKRLYLIDAIRALAIISMVFFHGFYDYLVFSGANTRISQTGAFHIWEQTICWTFIFISGYCRAMGRKNLKRGIMVLVCAVIISVVTYFATPDDFINFGVLCFIGSAMLILIPFDKLFKKMNPFVGLIVFALLFFLTFDIPNGYIGYEGLKICKMPDFLYANYLTAYLGFPHPQFTSGDYFPVIPWINLFVCGYFTQIIIDTKCPKFKEILKFKVPVLSQVGRYSLLIYMAHQPILYGAFVLIYKFF